MLRQLRRLALVWLLAFLTASCGGGGDGDVANSGGIGGTGISSGSISSFGSIFVNGFEFDLTGATIKIDDLAGCDPKDLCPNPLKLGMVVNANVVYNDDGKTGSAIDVETEKALEGPVASVTSAVNGVRSVVILGTTVIVSQDDTVIDDAFDLSFDNINLGDVLEVHGFFNENDELEATRIEKKAGGGPGGLEVEIKGKIKQLSGSAPPGTFEIRNLTVHFDGATILTDIPGNTLADDLFVEVKGVLCDGTLCPIGDVDASKIEAKKSGGDIAKVSVEGIIASVNPSDARLFELNTAVGPIPVDAIGASFEPAGLVPASGLQVEVEGSSVSGTLVATKVKVGLRLKIEATVKGVLGSGRTGTLTLLVNPMPIPNGQVLPVAVNNSTMMVDQTGAVIPAASLDLGDINMSDFLKIRARLGDSGLIAAQVRRTNPDDVVLEGQGDLPPTGNPGVSGPLVSIFGIQFDTDLNTQYEDIGGNLVSDPSEFFSDVQPGSLIKIKDKAPVDGVLEEASFED